MNPEISILVPIYNTEKYLLRCFNSITDQTIKSYEVILVDDGSTDNSARICIEMTKKDSRFRYFNKENSGLGSVRNMGISLAKSDYILFLDSDDYLDPNLIEHNLRILQTEKSDSIVFGYTKILIDNTSANYIVSLPPKIIQENSTHSISSYIRILDAGCGFSVWNQIFDKKFIVNNGLTFPQFKRGADMFFLLDYYSKKPKIITNPQSYYNYIAFKSQGKYDPSMILNHIKLYEKFIVLYQEIGTSKYHTNYAVKLFLLWFAHVIPSAIYNNQQFKKKEKLEQLEQLVNHKKISQWITQYKISDTTNQLSKFLLLIMKTRSATLIYYFTRFKQWVKENFRFNYKRLFENR